MTRHRAAALSFLVLLFTAHPVGAQHLAVWHAYRGNEQTALQQVFAAYERTHPGTVIDELAVPFDAYASKLESAIPHGHGPDVFIDAHERLASYRERALLTPAEITPAAADRVYDLPSVRAFTVAGTLWGLPLSLKCAALYLSTALWHRAPPDTIEAITALRASLPPGTYPLVYEASSAYFHAAIARAYGSGLVDDRGDYLFVGPGAERSVSLVRDWIRAGIVPDEASGALVSELFASGRAVAAISGPWLAAEINQRTAYTVVPLPAIADADGGRMRPYVTVEGVMVSSHARDPALAWSFAGYLAGPEGARVRALTGHQVVANSAAWRNPAVDSDPLLTAFRQAAAEGLPMPTHPHMRAAWEPAHQAILKVLRGDMSPAAALAEGARRFADVTRPLPPPRNPLWAELAVGTVGLVLALSAVRRARDPALGLAVRRSLPAYAWMAHAAVIVVALVVAPLVIGAATSLYATRDGHAYYVGVANYVDILTARGGPLLASGSFYRVLAVTVLWTVVNIALHVSIGVALALMLSQPLLRLRAVYRVLLIVPWAVPSYVTALAWKGMFHRQYGAVNALIAWAGGHPVSWFARFGTAFTANVATNVWLGFPFMMVVTLGALTAIPKDLYEAAAVDGATAWQRFTRITLPLLRSSLGPAVAMGAVWTFNQFNVVFLVSGGEPDGETDILVSEAYRWAFTRQAQYGYAAAYAVLIFGILALVTRANLRKAPR